MTEFIAGLFCGAIAMFFAIGWLWLRIVEQAEPSKPSEDIAA